MAGGEDEPAARETAFLLRLTSSLLSAPLSMRERAKHLVEFLVEDGAEVACVYVGTPGAMHVVAAHPEPVEDAELSWSSLVADAERASVVQRDHVVDETLRALLDRLGLEAAIIAPVPARDTFRGALLVGVGAQAPSEMSVARTERIAKLAGFALEKAHLHAEVERARRARDDILAIVAHDLRNPLTAARLAANRLEKAAGIAQHAESVRVVTRSVERALSLVEDLLDLSVVETGRLSFTFAQHPVSRIVADARTLLGPIASAAGLTLTATVSDDAGVVTCDSKRLLQVLSNLVGNAVKFTKPPGTITLRARRTESHVEFAVEDTGRGIAPDELPRVFDRFFQTKRGEMRGAGLGLPIAKAIVEQHGGTISVQSTLGMGTAFVFTIPTTSS